jgi:hypothetical protein
MKKTIQEMKEELQNVKSETVQIKNQNQELKSQNEKLTGIVQQQSKEFENLKNPDSKAVQVNLSGNNGVISFLKQNDPNPAELSCSNFYLNIFIFNILKFFFHFFDCFLHFLFFID